MGRLRRLVVFCRVFELGGMTEAARASHSTQSTVSKQISALEQELGHELFHRSGSGVTATTAGHLLYPLAIRTLSAYADLSAAAAGLRPGRGTIMFAASNVPGHRLAARWWREFSRAHPGIEQCTVITNSEDAVRRLLDGRADLAWVGIRVPGGGIRYLPVETDRLVLVLPDSPEFSDWTQADLARGPWVWRETGSAIRRLAQEYLAAQGYQPGLLPSAGEFGDSEAVVDAVRAGLGIGFVSASSLAGQDGIRPVPGIAIERQLYLAAPPEDRTSVSADRFWRFLTTRADSGEDG